MTTVFIAALLMSVTGALLVVCLSILRPVTGKCFNASWHYRVYILILIFMLVPIGAVGGGLLASITNETDSRMPNVPVIINDFITAPQNNSMPQQQPNIPQINAAAPESAAAPIEAEAESPSFTLNLVLSCIPLVWLAGALMFLTWQCVRLARFKRKIMRTSLLVEDATMLSVLDDTKTRMKIRGNLRLVSNNIVKTPMLTGLFRTYLILPEVEMSNRELSVILKHELVHFKRRDLCVKSLALLVNAIHWFNPAAHRLTKQIDTFCELSCDERVVADMSMEERQFYGETILNVLCRVVSQHSGVYATLAESKKGIKKRLTHMMNAKKTPKRVALISLVVAALLCLADFAAASIMNMNGAGDVIGDLESIPPQEDTDNMAEVDTRPVIETELWVESYINILLNNAEFYSTDAGKNIRMDQLTLVLTGEEDRIVSPLYFTVIDLDADGTPEVVIWLKWGEDEYFAHEILSCWDGIVYGYTPTWRAFYELKTDGTYWYSSGALDNGFGTMTFKDDTFTTHPITYCESDWGGTFYVNNEKSTEDGFQAAVRTQDEKQGVAWYDFNEGNVNTMLSASNMNNGYAATRTETITMEGLDEEIQTKLYVSDNWLLYYDFERFDVLTGDGFAPYYEPEALNTMKSRNVVIDVYIRGGRPVVLFEKRSQFF